MAPSSPIWHVLTMPIPRRIVGSQKKKPVEALNSANAISVSR